jgi:hypothetical protein
VLPVVFLFHRITIQGLLQEVLVQKRHAHVLVPEARLGDQAVPDLLQSEAHYWGQGPYQ